MSPEHPAEELSSLIDEIAAELEALPADDRGRVLAGELREALEALHREALARIVQRLRDDDLTLPVLRELAADPVVRDVLVAHGILRAPIALRAEAALGEVRPFLNSHGGDVELVDMEGAVVRVRLTGACRGCPAATATLRLGVEEALRRHIPELERMEVVHALADEDEEASPFQLIALPEPGWRRVLSAAELPADRVVRVRVRDTDLIVARAGDRVVGYLNRCAHLDWPLDEGVVSGGVLTCLSHGFQYSLETGQCLTVREVQLEPFEVRERAGQIEVREPAA